MVSLSSDKPEYPLTSTVLAFTRTSVAKIVSEKNKMADRKTRCLITL
jgi:hypothetical protein